MVDGFNLLFEPQFFRAFFFQLHRLRTLVRKFQTSYFRSGQKISLCPAINLQSTSMDFERMYLSAQINFEILELIEIYKNYNIIFSTRHRIFLKRTFSIFTSTSYRFMYNARNRKTCIKICIYILKFLFCLNILKIIF